MHPAVWPNSRSRPGALRRYLPDIPAACLALLGGVLTAHHFATSLNSHHTGLMFKTAVDLAHGLLPYRDTMAIYGILTSWIQAVSVVAFSGSVLGVGIATAVMYTALLLSTYALWRHFLTPMQATVPLAIYLAMASRAQFVWPNYYSQVFVLLSAIAAGRWRRSQHARWLIVSGAALGLAYLARHQTGIFPIAAIALFVAYVTGRERQSFRRALDASGALLAGLAIVPAPLFLGLASIHAIHDWNIQTNLSVPRYFWKVYGLPEHLPDAIRNAGTVLLRPPWGLLGLLMMLIAVAIVCAQLVFRRHDTRSRSIDSAPVDTALLAALIALSTWPQAYPLGDDFRFAIGLSPALGVIAWALLQLGPAGIPSLLRLSPLFLLLYPFASQVQVTMSHLRELVRYVKTPCAAGTLVHDVPALNGLCLEPRYAEFYRSMHQSISAYAKDHPGAGVITFMGDPIPLTFANVTEQPHPVFIVWPSIRWFRSHVRTPANPNLLPEAPPTGNLSDDTANTLLYPDYWEVVRSYIATHHPLILSPHADVAGYRVRMRVQLPSMTYVYYQPQFGGGDTIFLLEPAQPGS